MAETVETRQSTRMTGENARKTAGAVSEVGKQSLQLRAKRRSVTYGDVQERRFRGRACAP
jgi:hypothetical protein